MLDALNALFRRIAELLESERRFTADAAHELRTPIAGIRAQAQVALGLVGGPHASNFFPTREATISVLQVAADKKAAAARRKTASECLLMPAAPAYPSYFSTDQ